MAVVPLQSITVVRISLRVDGEPQLLILMNADGLVKRMGYSALHRYEEAVATDRIPGVFEDFMSAVPPKLLERAGSYEDPGREGHLCQWRLEFEGEDGVARFDLSYASGSAGLPPAMARLVERAESLTDGMYQDQLGVGGGDDASVSGPADVGPRTDSEPPVAPVHTPGLDVAEAHAPWSIGQYLSFEGRIGRADYIVQYLLPLMALSFAGSFADGLVGLAGESGVGPMGVMASLLTFWPSMAGWAKRMHDFGVSLWILPKVMLGGVVAVGLGLVVHPGLGVVAMGLFALVFFALCIASYVWPGTDGPNEYGPPRIS